MAAKLSKEVLMRMRSGIQDMGQAIQAQALRKEVIIHG